MENEVPSTENALSTTALYNLKADVRVLMWTIGIVGFGLVGSAGFGITQLLSMTASVSSIQTDNLHFKEDFKSIQNSLADLGRKIDNVDLKLTSIQTFQKASLDQKDAIEQLALQREWTIFSSSKSKKFLSAVAESGAVDEGIVVFKTPQAALSMAQALRSLGYDQIPVRNMSGDDGILLTGSNSWHAFSKVIDTNISDDESVKLYVKNLIRAKSS